MFELIPQCPSGDNWSDPDLNQPTKWLELTMSALADVEKEFSIDPDRIYLAGQSMGGLGVWSGLQAVSGQVGRGSNPVCVRQFHQCEGVGQHTALGLFRARRTKPCRSLWCAT